MTKSESIIQFFAAERKASRKFKTHDLIGVYFFYPRSQSNLDYNATKSEITELGVTNQLIHSLHKEIAIRSNELEELKNKINNFEEKLLKERNQYLKWCAQSNNKVVKMSKQFEVKNIPVIKRLSRDLVYKSDLTNSDILVIDDKPIEVKEYFNLIVVIMNLVTHKRFKEIDQIHSVLQENLSHNYSKFIMNKVLDMKFSKRECE